MCGNGVELMVLADLDFELLFHCAILGIMACCAGVVNRQSSKRNLA